MKKRFQLDADKKPFFIFWLIIAVAHFVLPLQWADDGVFRKEIAKGYWVFMGNANRPISHSVVYLCTRFPLLWRLINPVVLTMFARTLSQMLSVRPEHKKTIAVFVSCACIYPCMVVVDAGFVATTVNYLWPGLCALLTVKFLQDAMANEKTPFWQYVVSIPLILYATNMQQIGAIMLLVFGVAIVVLLCQRKKISFYIIFAWLLYLFGVGFVLHINMTGVGNRMSLETARYFPTFSELSVFQKAELGLSSTFFCLTMWPHFSYGAFLAFLILLAICVSRTALKGQQKAAIWIAVAEVIVFGILWYVPGYSLGYKTYVMDQAEYALAIMPYFFYGMLVVLLLYPLYFLLGRRKFVQALFLFALGIISRVTMGFSPTVWASGHRTFFVLYIMLIAVSAMAIDASKTIREQR